MVKIIPIIFLLLFSCSDIPKVYTNADHDIVTEALELWNEYEPFEYQIVYQKAGADLIIKSVDEINYMGKSPKGIYTPGAWDTIKYRTGASNKLYVITHELGHWRGHGHSRWSDSIMNGDHYNAEINFMGL